MINTDDPTRHDVAMLKQRFHEFRLQFSFSRPKYTPELIESTMELLASGDDPAWLGKQLGLPKETVMRWSNRKKKLVRHPAKTTVVKRGSKKSRSPKAMIKEHDNFFVELPQTPALPLASPEVSHRACLELCRSDGQILRIRLTTNRQALANFAREFLSWPQVCS